MFYFKFIKTQRGLTDKDHKWKYSIMVYGSHVKLFQTYIREVDFEPLYHRAIVKASWLKN